MPPPHRSLSPEVAALRAAAEDSVRQIRDQVREQARLIRSGTLGELTEADIARMAKDITTAAQTRLDAAAPPDQGPSADPELETTRREAAQLMAAVARQVDVELRQAWQAPPAETTRGWWRR